VAHGGPGDDGQLARPLLPEDRLAGGADAARALADALQLREVADGVVALAANRAQRRGLVLQEPVAEDAAARGRSLSSGLIKRPERGEAAAQVEVLLLERLHLPVEDADQLVDLVDTVAQLVVRELAGEVEGVLRGHDGGGDQVVRARESGLCWIHGDTSFGFRFRVSGHDFQSCRRCRVSPRL
jgi:hypothetical protein